MLAIVGHHLTFDLRVPDGPLIERILADDNLTEGVVVRHTSQLLCALEHLHQLNIAHLDIKVGHVAVM